ncbi:MAG: type IV secretory system conjugative DNA transfer family protein [Rhizobiaceae bacterium]|nr:type IV secretory system conjugative DNA transfer family protein [Rhizobiaceae bacterium]
MINIARRVIGLTFDGRPIFEPLFSGSSITYAAAGGGKTTCVSVPAILSMLADKDCALFINDVKDGEIAAQIAPICEKYGRKFGIVDEFDVLPGLRTYRVSLNPFGSLQDVWGPYLDDLPFILENIDHALIEEPKDDTKNFYWRETPREFLDLGTNLLLSRNPRLAYPGGLYALLSDPQSWTSALEIEAEEGEDHLKSAARQMLDLRQHNPEHYTQHLRAALTALKIFAHRPLKDAGRRPDLTHANLIKDNWVVCFVNPARYAARLGSFYALHFLALMNAQLTGTLGHAEYILDEFCNAPLRDAVSRVTIQRAFRARSHFITQSRQDAVRRYGEKETAILEENCTVKQWLKFSNFEEAERVSKAMGERTSVSHGLGVSSDRSSFTGNFSTGRDRIFTADELMRLPADEQIIHVSDVGFIHCRKIRQNQIAPYCFDLGDNPLEGGRLKPDPKVTLRTPDREDVA